MAVSVIEAKCLGCSLCVLACPEEAVIAPAGIDVSGIALLRDIPVMIIVSVACLPIFFTGHRIERWEGVLFFAYYVIYLAYLILGETHPHIRKATGDGYRHGLHQAVRRLGLENHVRFHNRFVELDVLLQYIQAADLYVTPYLNLDQIVSGTLAYALGAGSAIVSTPYWHAKELLAEGRGVLVPPSDPQALAQEVNRLLNQEDTLQEFRTKGYAHGRSMIWGEVARGLTTRSGCPGSSRSTAWSNNSKPSKSAWLGAS